MSDSDSSDDDLAGVFTAFDIVKTDELADSDIVKQNLATKRKVHDAFAAGPTPAERDRKKMELHKRRKRPIRELMDDESDNVFSSPAKKTKNQSKNVFDEDDASERNAFDEHASTSSPALKPLKKISKEKSLKPLKGNSFASSDNNPIPSPKKKSKKSAPAMDMGVMPTKKASNSIPAGNLDKSSIPDGESAVCGLSGIVLRNGFS